MAQAMNDDFQKCFEELLNEGLKKYALKRAEEIMAEFQKEMAERLKATALNSVLEISRMVDVATFSDRIVFTIRSAQK